MLFDATLEELDEVKETCFTSLNPLKMKVFPRKEKRKYLCLFPIIEVFEPNRHYTEKEINIIIEAIHEDYCTIRRYLVDYGFLSRTSDGKDYWLNEETHL